MKICGFKDGGYNSCRRDVIVKNLVGKNVVYYDSRRQAFYLLPLRTIEDLLTHVSVVFCNFMFIYIVV